MAAAPTPNEKALVLGSLGAGAAGLAAAGVTIYSTTGEQPGPVLAFVLMATFCWVHLGVVTYTGWFVISTKSPLFFTDPYFRNRVDDPEEFAMYAGALALLPFLFAWLMS